MKSKLIPWLLPAAALIAASLWISSQRRELSELQSGNQRIAALVERARDESRTMDDPSLVSRMRGKPLRSAKGIDWKHLANSRAGMQSADGMPDMRSMVELQKTLRAFSSEEILAGLDEIASLEIPAAAKKQLEGILIGILADKDPEAALQRYATKLGEDNGMLNWQLANALKKWSADDPGAASAWMDEQIRSGTFDSKSLDGKNTTHQMFEASLIQSLVVSDPSAAAARLAAMPEDQRAAIFNHSMAIQFKPGQSRALADLIRSQVPEEQRAQTLANLAKHSAQQGGFERVSGILREIDASRDERKAIVAQALTTRLQHSSESAATYQETRDWIHANAPEDGGTLTGQALAQLAAGGKFEEMAGHALADLQSSGNDDTLAAFLMHAPGASRMEILALAPKISDPALRQQVEFRFINNPNRSAQSTGE